MDVSQTEDVYDAFDVWIITNLLSMQGWVSNGPLDEHPAWVSYKKLRATAIAEAVRQEREACARTAFGAVFGSDLVGNHELADKAASAIRARTASD